MFNAIVYGRNITGKSFTEIKRKASVIANSFYNSFDKMEVSHDNKKFSFIRINKIYPNNIIERGLWR